MIVKPFYIKKGFLTGVGLRVKNSAKLYGLIVGIDCNILTVSHFKTYHVYLVYKIIDNDRLELSAYQIPTQKSIVDFIHFAKIITSLNQLIRLFKLLNELKTI